jgi:hypothetical protein
MGRQSAVLGDDAAALALGSTSQALGLLTSSAGYGASAAEDEEGSCSTSIRRIRRRFTRLQCTQMQTSGTLR